VSPVIMIMVAVIVIMIGVTVVVAGVAVTPTVMAPAVMASATGAGTTSPATCGICLADSAYAIIPGKHLGDTAEEQGRRYRGGEQALCEYSAHLATLLGLAATVPETGSVAAQRRSLSCLLPFGHDYGPTVPGNGCSLITI